MNIGFEAKRIFRNFTGLGNYGRFVVGALAEHFPQNTYRLYTPTVTSGREVTDLTSKPGISVVQPRGLFALPMLSSIWRAWAISSDETVRKLDIFHGLSQELPFDLPVNVKRVVTVHDLIFLRFPEMYNPIDVRIYHTKVKRACNDADVIVAISEQTASDLVEKLSISREKIRVVYQGCHPDFIHQASETTKEQVRRKYNLPSQYLLNIGTIEKRKNLELLIRAISLIDPKDRLPLVVVGRATKYHQYILELITQLKLNDWVRFIHNAAFADLPSIYQMSQAFIYPSLFEGFGIPLVEAIASGTPVITSTGSCFREAAGPAAVFVDPDDAEDMARQITRITTDRDYRHKVITGSARYIERFRPAQIAQDMMRVYQEIV